jgi:hypothetical protein
MDINFTTDKSKIRTIRPGDKHFQIPDKFVLYQRAGFEISANCPREYMKVIQLCYANGWLKPVANMSEKEYIFMGLTND